MAIDAALPHAEVLRRGNESRVFELSEYLGLQHALESGNLLPGVGVDHHHLFLLPGECHAFTVAGDGFVRCRVSDGPSVGKPARSVDSRPMFGPDRSGAQRTSCPKFPAPSANLSPTPQHSWPSKPQIGLGNGHEECTDVARVCL
jgi:hypothetical protein